MRQLRRGQFALRAARLSGLAVAQGPPTRIDRLRGAPVAKPIQLRQLPLPCPRTDARSACRCGCGRVETPDNAQSRNAGDRTASTRSVCRAYTAFSPTGYPLRCLARWSMAIVYGGLRFEGGLERIE